MGMSYTWIMPQEHPHNFRSLLEPSYLIAAQEGEPLGDLLDFEESRPLLNQLGVIGPQHISSEK